MADMPWPTNHCESTTYRKSSAPFAPRNINKRLCSNQLPTSSLPADGVCVQTNRTGGRFCAHMPCGQAGGGGHVPEGIGGNGYVRGPVQGVVPRKRHDGPCSTTLRASCPEKEELGRQATGAAPFPPADRRGIPPSSRICNASLPLPRPLTLLRPFLPHLQSILAGKPL